MTAIDFALAILLLVIAICVWLLTIAVSDFLGALTDDAALYIESAANHRTAQATTIMHHAGLLDDAPQD